MGPLPWSSIDLDGQGVDVVIVSGDNLENFPLFMSSILKEKIGMDQGVFKIRLDDNTDRPTKLSELTSFIKNFFKTKAYVEPDPDFGEEGRWEYPKLQQQQFFFGQQDDHLYGFKAAKVPETVAGRQRNAFVKKLGNPDVFSTVVDSCCSRKLSESVDALDQHFWSVIRSSSQKSCGIPDEEHDVKQMLDVAAGLRQKYCYSSDAIGAFTHERTEGQSSDETAECVPSSLSKPTTPMLLYAPGIPLKDQSFPICSKFSLSNLRTLLDEYDLEAGGISYPYLYVAYPHSSFPWHTEDKMLFSINYVHYGAPCVWYFVPPKYYKKFLDLVPFFPLDPKHTSCNGILGGSHKYLMASKDFLEKLGVPVLTVIQQEREIIVTYPFALHSGFKMGWNIQEAANFADEWWVEPALLTPICDCFRDTVQIDLAKFIAICRPHLLEMYVESNKIGLLQALSKNPFIVELGLLPHLQEEVHLENIVEQENTCDNPREEELAYKFEGSRFALQCPDENCTVQYEGGRAKLHRLRNHIEKSHIASAVTLVQKLAVLYPPKQRKTKTASICPKCNELKFGGTYELKLHMKRKHGQL